MHIDEFLGFLVFMLVIVIAMTLFIGGAFLGTNYYYEYTCGKYGETTGRSTQWVFMDDCYLSTGDDVLTLDEYKAVIVARDGLK